MKRIQWTIAVALVGFLVTGKEQIYLDFGRTMTTVCWAAVMGLGIGTLVDKQNPTRCLRVYWSLTLAPVFALIGLLIAPYSYDWTLPQVFYSAGGGAVGALVGIVAGTVHGKRVRGANSVPSTP